MILMKMNFISIMFEMKNGSGWAEKKHKNADFYKDEAALKNRLGTRCA